MNRADEQRAWNDVTERYHRISKTGLMQGHFKHLHISKEVSTRHHYGAIPKTLSGKPACCRASLKSLYANVFTQCGK